MTDTEQGCTRCGRKIMQSVSNRCLYCGAALPEEFHLDEEGRSALLNEKLAQLKRNEENAGEIISGMRRDFGIPEKKSRRQRRKESKDAKAAAAAAAAASISSSGGGDGGGACG